MGPVLLLSFFPVQDEITINEAIAIGNISHAFFLNDNGRSCIKLVFAVKKWWKGFPGRDKFITNLRLNMKFQNNQLLIA